MLTALLVGLVGDRAIAQRRDSAVFHQQAVAPRPDSTVSHGPVDTPRAQRAAKREAEQRRRRVDFLDARSLNPVAAFAGKPKPLWGTTLLTSGDEQTMYVLVRRTVSSTPEVHARWDDIVMIRAGNGAIEVGDSLVGSKYRAPGERAGGTIATSHRLVVHAGDLIRIPAAVPHAFIVGGTEPLEYLVIKQRRQQLPIRWFGDR